ncbi:MAG: hypothetical protein ACD_48C00461G0002, partial [uncultured bacterium]
MTEEQSQNPEFRRQLELEQRLSSYGERVDVARSFLLG